MKVPMFSVWNRVALAAVCLAFITLSACAPKDPIEQISELRGKYNVELNGFTVKQTPVEPVVEEAVEGEEATADAAGEAAAGEGEEAVEEVEVRQDVLLDILVQSDTYDQLPGLTLDIIQVDADKNQKNRILYWLDTSGMVKGQSQQVSYLIEDADYVEGDGFLVEVRDPVPAAERGDYAEYGSAE